MVNARILIPVVLVALATGLFVDRTLTKTKVISIRQARGPLDSKLVALQGQVYPLGDNRFLLVDATGKAEMDTCPLWYKRIAIDPGETALVTGERLVEKPTSKDAAFVVSVFSIEGSRSGLIIVRKQMGKPPWLLGRNP